MQQNQFSRRSFLSAMAILTSGTLVAGSPMGLLEDGNADIRKSWKKFVEINAGTSFWGSTKFPVAEVAKGHSCEAGDVIAFPQYNMLAQPNWIYWGDKNKASDIIINFFENDPPYKKTRSINRFEMEAFLQLAERKNEKDLLLSLCNTDPTAAKRLLVKTRIKRSKQQVHDVALYENNNLTFKKQLFYNV